MTKFDIGYANRAGLDAWGKVIGVRRRWFGLEPEASYRRRLVEAMNNPDGLLNRPRCDSGDHKVWKGPGTVRHKSGWVIFAGHCVRCGRRIGE